MVLHSIRQRTSNIQDPPMRAIPHATPSPKGDNALPKSGFYRVLGTGPVSRLVKAMIDGTCYMGSLPSQMDHNPEI